MKRILIFASLALILATRAMTQVIPLATGEWAPYTGEKLAGQGLVTEIVTAAFKAGGLQTGYSFFPWNRCELAVQDGSAFAAFPYAMTEERKKLYDFSSPVMNSRSVVFYYEGQGKDMDWASLKDFQKVKLGAGAGYWYIEDLKKNGLAYDTVADTDTAFKMLQAGRFQYFIENEVVGKETIKRLFPKDTTKFKTLSKPYDENQFFLIVSRKYPGAAELLKKFNTGLAVVKADGTYKAVLAKYDLAGQ